MNKQEIIELIKDNLSITVDHGNYGEPETVRVQLWLGSEVISYDYIDVKGGN